MAVDVRVVPSECGPLALQVGECGARVRRDDDDSRENHSDEGPFRILAGISVDSKLVDGRVDVVS